MFKHASHPHESEEKKASPPTVEEKLHSSAADAPARGGGDTNLRELMEKNLKWSQIIYEQNRKIHRKLLWTAAASWLKLIIIAVPIIWALLALPGLVQDYNCFIRGTNCPAGSSQRGSLEDILKYVPLDSAQREQIKAILK